MKHFCFHFSHLSKCLHTSWRTSTLRDEEIPSEFSSPLPMFPSKMCVLASRNGPLSKRVRILCYQSIFATALLSPKSNWCISETPLGTLPVLSVDGVEFGQTQAILRYLAKEFGRPIWIFSHVYLISNYSVSRLRRSRQPHLCHRRFTGRSDGRFHDSHLPVARSECGIRARR